MRADELAAPDGDIYKFTNVGDTLEGTVVYVGAFERKDTKYGPATMFRLSIQPREGDPVTLWPIQDDGQCKAIARALREGGLPALEAGQRIKLRFNEEIDTGKGNPFKSFLCRVERGQAQPEPDLQLSPTQQQAAPQPQYQQPPTNWEEPF